MALKLPIYMDNHATTPVDPRVLEAMLPYFTEKFGNAASRNHAFGWTAEEAVDYAREQIAEADRRPEREGDRLHLRRDRERQPRASRAWPSSTRRRATTSSRRVTEHKAVLDTCKRLEKEGFEVTYLPVDKDGLRRPRRAVATAITDKTILVSIMLANNEIGTVQPHRARSARSRARRACSSTPTRCRASARSPFDVETMNVDLASHHRAQDVRPQGRRRALRAPQQAARAPRRADGRRRPRARHALGHAERPGHRRLRQGRRDRDGRDGATRRRALVALRERLRTKLHDRARRGRTSTARSSTACRATSTSPSPSSRARR